MIGTLIFALLHSLLFVPQYVPAGGRFPVSGGGSSPALVQSVSFNCTSTVTICTVDAAHGGLATVSAGHFVVVNLDPGGVVPTSVTSTPVGTWTGVDVFGNVALYAICNSAAFTAVNVNLPSSATVRMTVSEYSGIITGSCIDKTGTIASCSGSTAWSTGASGTVTQNSELLLAWGIVGATSTATATAPFTIVTTLADATNFRSIWLASQIVNTAPASYTAAGTTANTATCFSNIVTVKAI